MTVEVRHLNGAIVVRGVGELDERLAWLVGEAATFPNSVPIVVDLSELNLARVSVLESLLHQLVPSNGTRDRQAIVVCRRLSGRRMVRRAARSAPVPVVATVDEALRGLRSANVRISSVEGHGLHWQPGDGAA
ncbi:MAG: hypothetical protein M3179_06665 [Actinomycetota bacterium]|nr:hypothetical protein [Actinomycetota bacterium]